MNVTNLVLFLLLVIVYLSRMITATNRRSFIRRLNVTIENYAGVKMVSKSEMKDVGECAKFCNNKDCLAFVFNRDENGCDLYSTYFWEDNKVGPKAKAVFSRVPEDCADVGVSSPPGVYKILLPTGKLVDVYCETTAADGPWTVIQNRFDGSVRFDRGWTPYKNGFGDITGEFWLGNDIIYALTQTPKVLQIELRSFNNKAGYAEYSEFRIDTEENKYKSNIGGYSGNVSRDCMEYHNGRIFSTPEGGACGHAKGGWWYDNCHQANLNGMYTTAIEHSSEYFITWWWFPGPEQKTPLKSTRMMIRQARV